MMKAPKLARRWGIGGLAGIAMLGGLASFAAPASADVSATAVTLSGTAASIAQGGVGVATAGWTFAIPSSAAAGDELQFAVNPKGITGATVNCSAGNYVSFAGTPTVAVSGSSGGLLGLGAGTAPTLTISAPFLEAGAQSDCATIGVQNEITVTVTAAASAGLLGGGSYTATISGIAYTVGPNATLGAVSTADSDFVNATTGTPAPTALTVPSNATVIMGVTVAANNPPSALTYNADTNVPISPIDIVEGAGGQVPKGYVCVKLLSGTFDLSTVTPTVTAGSDLGTTGLAVTGGTVTNPSANTLAFDVTTASTTTATGFAISNIQVDGGNELGPVGFTVTDDSSSSCAGGNAVNTNGARAFSVLYPFRTAGLVADATAADEMEAAFPYPNSCPASKSVVLATDANFPDALSASYLAGVLNTGILLTPTAALSTYTVTALAAEGITQVFVVGGPLAVSQNVISTLQSTAAYTCGAKAALSPTQDLKVTVLAGQTQYDTSQVIATAFQSVPADIGQLHFAGAYGRYNNTTGAESISGPTTAEPTAILATGENFEDASAASVLGYADKLPVILTTPDSLSTQAQTSLTDDGIQQVILVGGPLAVSDTVVEQVEGLGISLIRIAGQDYTDTAQELARFELSSTSSTAGPEGLGWDANSDHAIVLARGDFYSDSLAGAPYAAEVLGAGHPVPILLTYDPNTIGTYLTGFLNAAGSSTGAAGDGAASTVDTVLVVGGTEAISATTLNTILIDLAAG